MINTPKITKERIKQYLAEGKRFDRRTPEDFREIIIDTNVSKKAEGSARVKIGKTEVIVGVKMDVGTPYPDSPDKGNLSVNTELTPMSSPRFENGPPKFPAIEIARVIDRGIRESKFIEFENLCIKEGEKVWNVFVDIYTINDDGNLLDAAGIGAVVALKNSKIPKYDEKSEKALFGELTDKNIPLSKEVPIALTFYKLGDRFLVDPTKEEEDSSDTRVTIGSFGGTISSMQKGNSDVITSDDVDTILRMNEKINKEIFKKIGGFVR